MGTWSGAKVAAKAGQQGIAREALDQIGALWGDPATEYRISWPIIGRIARLS